MMFGPRGCQRSWDVGMTRRGTIGSWLTSLLDLVDKEQKCSLGDYLADAKIPEQLLLRGATFG
jgi:hypothetical protein